MKRILVVDWLDKYGGAERVISKIYQTFRFDKVYALVNVMAKEDIRKTFLNQNPEVGTTILQIFGKYFRAFFFLFHWIVKRITIDKSVHTIISSSHAVAKGVRKNKKQLHISYFQARNFKYIWEEAPLYFGNYLPLFRPLLSILQSIDKKQAQLPDYIISNSFFVQQWVKETYDRDSVVIYPPVDLIQFPLQTSKEDYFVAVGRIVSYKRFDLIVEAFSKSDKKLIIVGDGEQLAALKKNATANISFTGFLDAEQVYAYISKAKAFIHIGVEDFGIAPIEAQSCGTPVIAYRAGGIKETVIENITGIFFNEQTTNSLNEAIQRFEDIEWDYQRIHQHAQTFSEDRFCKEITAYVSSCEQEFFKNNI